MYHQAPKCRKRIHPIGNDYIYVYFSFEIRVHSLFAFRMRCLHSHHHWLGDILFCIYSSLLWLNRIVFDVLGKIYFSVLLMIKFHMNDVGFKNVLHNVEVISQVILYTYIGCSIATLYVFIQGWYGRMQYTDFTNNNRILCEFVSFVIHLRLHWNCWKVSSHHKRQKKVYELWLRCNRVITVQISLSWCSRRWGCNI